MHAADNTSIIIVRKTHLTVALCIYIVVLYIFYMKQLFTNVFCFTFKQRMLIHMMCMQTCGAHTMVTKPTFEPVSFIIHFNKPTHLYNFSLLASFPRLVKINQQNNQTHGSESRGQGGRSKQCPDRLETHTREYFTGTRVLKIKNGIIKQP